MLPIRFMRHIVVVLALVALGIGAAGCGIFGTGGSTQPIMTRASMVQTATVQEKSFSLVEGSLNAGFANAWLPPTLHVTLDPYIKAGRKGVDKLTADALDPTVTPSAFSETLKEVIAVMEPLLQAQAQASLVKKTSSPPVH